MLEPWRTFPRLYELFEKSNQAHRDNYFVCCRNTLSYDLAPECYAKLENRLSLLSVSAWEALRSKALPYIDKKRDGIIWSQLFDTLNEAYGYELLLNAGYEKEDIEFIQSSRRAPDLKGSRMDESTLVEVKTINYSDREIKRPQSPPQLIRVNYEMPPPLITQIESTVTEAVKQLNSYCDTAQYNKIVLVLLSLDSDIQRGNELDSQIRDIKSKYLGCEVEIKIINEI
ncbi:MAG: hypothetical protein H3C30_08120 [Candidatus Hydrogenedentes bacterium]|nr:hypothetical protein [Candidatus Hydrogenedentota bacterium]